MDFVRHYDKWWRHAEAWERYDYAYSDEELKEWIPKIQQLDDEAPLTLVYMNNHWQGQAVGTARQLKMLMEGEEDRQQARIFTPKVVPVGTV